MPSFRRGAVLFGFLSLAACSNGDDPSTLSCPELGAALHARAMTTDDTCTASSDCAAVGYPVRDDGTPTCNCGVTFARTCGGDAVNRAAWTADTTAAAMLAEWQSRCVAQGVASGASNLCDCTTSGTTCSPAGRCVAQVFDCFNPFDAGVQ